MPNFYYTDANGQRGLVNEHQLKALAVQGVITPDTLLETEAGHKGKAGRIKGLFATVPLPAHPFCTRCGNSISEEATTCTFCGARPTGHRKYCRRCGMTLNTEQVACVKCGATIDTTDEYEDMVSDDDRRMALASNSFIRLFGLSLALGTFASISLVMAGSMEEGIGANILYLLGFLLAPGAFIVGFLLIISIVRLATLLHFNVGVLVALLVFCYPIALLVALVLNNQAQAILKRSGYKVGFFGINMRQFDDDGDDGDDDDDDDD